MGGKSMVKTISTCITTVSSLRKQTFDDNNGRCRHLLVFWDECGMRYRVFWDVPGIEFVKEGESIIVESFWNDLSDHTERYVRYIAPVR